MKSENFKREQSEMNSEFVDTKKAKIEAEFAQKKAIQINPNMRTIDMIEAKQRLRAKVFEEGLFRK